MLRSNLKYLRTKNKISQEEMAILLGISRSTYSNYEKGKSEPPAGMLLKISNHFSVRTDDLLSSDLGVPLFHQKPEKADSILSDDIRILPITISGEGRQNVEFVQAKALAGYVAGIKDQGYISKLPRFRIPKLPEGSYRAFEIEGHSMPPIHDGYIVIGKFVEHARDIKNGGRYILILRDGDVVFKKVISELNKGKRFILASDNSEFLPYSVLANDILEAWELAAFIGFPNKIDMNYILLDRLQNIEKQIALLVSRNPSIEMKNGE